MSVTSALGENEAVGRWGDKINQSDTVLDFFGDLEHRMLRELLFWLQPEELPGQDSEHCRWVAGVLSVIEMMLLFEQHEGGSVHINHPTAVNRWRETFLGVWDGSWNSTDPTSELTQGYAVPAYRKQHRAAIVAMFDRLESIAHRWANIDQPAVSSDPLAPLLPEYPLPHFSDPNGDNRTHAYYQYFVADTLEYLVEFIVYWLSREMRPHALTTNIEPVWGAVDMLGFLSTAYDMSLVDRTQTVQSWQETTILIWKQFQAGCHVEWSEDELYRNVIAAFERLKRITSKRQSDSDWLYSWYDSLNLES